MIFGHFIYFGHFPIEIPIEAEKIYHHGKELSYRENKMCSETSEAVGTIWEHAQKEFQKFLKIRITLVNQCELFFHQSVLILGQKLSCTCVRHFYTNYMHLYGLFCANSEASKFALIC